MGCKGICEIKHYDFGWSPDLKTESSAGAKPLGYGEIDQILAQYFQDLKSDGDCATCGEGCQCDPFVTEEPERGAEFLELPEPIVATSGSDTYTLTGKIWLRAWITTGFCTGSSDSDAAPTPTPESTKRRTFALKKTFKPKARAGKCGCQCDKQVYVFKATAKTVITPKGSAPPLMLTGRDLDAWLGPKLKDAFEKEYSDEPLQECGGNCHCVTVSPKLVQWEPIHETLTAPKTIKITKKIEVPDFVPGTLVTNNYIITGECEVGCKLVKGVCVPKLELATAEAGGGH